MLTGKVVVIIGGSSGIGLSTAKAVHNQGAHVIIAGRSQAKLNTAVKAIGPGVRSFMVEIADENSVQNMFNQLDHVDHVFVTASQVVLGGIIETDTADLKSTLDSRVWGSYFSAKHALPKMNAGGSITFMSGSSTWKPAPGGAVAAAAGAAVESLGRALALDLSPIRVNTIAAGVIDTPLLDSFFGEKRTTALDHLTKTLPVKRMGEPQDIADAAMYLMNNKYTTGTVISVDGGILLT